VKLARLRKPKAAGSPSNVDCRLKTNAEILLDMVHPKRMSCTGGIGQRKETKNLNEIKVLTVQE
jgi:hypothetical protein